MEHAARFWSKVEKSTDANGCWIWIGATHRGYGRFLLDGRNCVARDVAWEAENGKRVPGMSLWSTCGNKACVRPDHLRALRRGNFVDSFWLHVQKDDGCWAWTASHDVDGYGQFKSGRAHRFSYELHHGAIPEGLLVCHHCDNPGCVNPAHLFLGTNADNNHDRDQKQRQCRGEDQHTAKLTERDVRTARALCTLGARLSEIALRFGVSRRTVARVATGESWKHVA